MGRTLIIGAGQAGRRCAEALRDLDPAAEILLLGEEAHRPYDRPPLSKAVLLGTDPGNGLFVRDADFYAEKRIALRTGTRVATLDPAARAVTTEAGERIGYDHLVIATGARARTLPVPGADLEGVHSLRTLDDALGISEALGSAARACVIGGGFIGLEVASALAARGDALRRSGSGTTRKPSARTSSSSGPSAAAPTTSCPRSRIARMRGSTKWRSEKSTVATSRTVMRGAIARTVPGSEGRTGRRRGGSQDAVTRSRRCSRKRRDARGALKSIALAHKFVIVGVQHL